MRWAWSFDRYVDLLGDELVGADGGELTLPRSARGTRRTSRTRRSLRRHLHRSVADRIRATYGRGSEIVLSSGGREALPRRPRRRRLLPRRVAAQRVQADRPRRARLHRARRAARRRRRRPGARGARGDRRPDRALRRPPDRPRDDVDCSSAAAHSSCRARRISALTPLEANAAGRPVVAFARGGALDTVRDGETGVLFHDATTESLEDALRAVQERHWDAALPPRATPRRSPRTSSSPASAPSSPPRWNRRSSGDWARTTQPDVVGSESQTLTRFSPDVVPNGVTSRGIYTRWLMSLQSASEGNRFPRPFQLINSRDLLRARPLHRLLECRGRRDPLRRGREGGDRGAVGVPRSDGSIRRRRRRI